jgi:hypothetical protein
MSTIIRLDNLTSKIKQLEKLSDTQTMAQIGEKALELNVDQINDHVDNKGKAFKKYSDSYRKQIIDAKKNIKISKKTGRARWGGKGKSRAQIGAKDPNEVNLTVSGKMLGNFGIVRVSKGEVEIGFNSVREKEKAKWNTENDRHFVGLTGKNTKVLFAWIKETFLSKH